MKKYICLFVLSFLLAPHAISATSNVELFSQSKEWLAIVHYQPKFFGGYEGTIESDHFYVSKEGRENPQAELEATIKMFNSGDVSRICYFPARFMLLQKNGFLEGVSYPHCPMYEDFYKELSPSGLTLLFTSAYMNNPSSLFGHTLFRIDSKNKGTDLLAHGVNYGAFVDESKTNPIVYAFQGLTGGYEGGFTVKPYYDIINDYNNIENRDIWEYKLNLNDEQLNVFVAHLWELGHSRAGYVFLSRNCSYLLMEVLDAVDPDLQLASEFPGHTIPLDTVRAVASKQGLIESYIYRSSRQNKIKSQYKQLSEKQKDIFFSVVRENKYDYQDLTEVETSDVLDTAYEYVQYEKSDKIIERKEYRERVFALLKEKKKFGKETNFKDLKEEENPLEAHKSVRLALGAGFRNGEAFQEIMFRPAYHSLTDNNYGYLRGAEINFLNGSVRHYDNRNKYVLNDLEILGLKSLAPMTSLFKNYSYNLKFSIDRVMNPDDEKEGYVFSTKTGIGLTYELWKDFYAFSMLNGYFAYGGMINQNQYAAVGPSVGAYYDLGDVRFLGEVESLFATSKFANRFRYNAEIAYSLSTNLTVAASYLYYDNYGHDVDESKLSLKYHF